MTEIRYWDPKLSGSTAAQANKEQTDKVKSINNNFTQQMADLFLGSDNDPMLDAFGLSTPDNLFGDTALDSSLKDRLNGIKNDGLDKVRAAQIQNTLPNFEGSSGYNNNKKNKNNDSMGGLSSFIELTVKMQIAQAKKQLQQIDSGSRLSFEDFIGSTQAVSAESIVSESQSVDQVVEDIRSQIAQASDKLGIDVADLKGKIL